MIATAATSSVWILFVDVSKIPTYFATVITLIAFTVVSIMPVELAASRRSCVSVCWNAATICLYVFSLTA